MHRTIAEAQLMSALDHQYGNPVETLASSVRRLPNIEGVSYLRPKIKLILNEFKQKLIELYGQRLTDLVLYGSVARHEAIEDSNINTLVVLRDETINHFDEIRRMSNAKIELLF